MCLHPGNAPLGSPVSTDDESELTDVFFFLFLSEDTVSSKLQNNNVYTIAKRNVEGQDMLYQSLKLTNGIWILAELRIQPGNPNYTVRSRGRGAGWDPSTERFLPAVLRACSQADAVNLTEGLGIPTGLEKVRYNRIALLPAGWDNAHSAPSFYLPRLPRDKAKRH